jgi:hypothetical protein
MSPPIGAHAVSRTRRRIDRQTDNRQVTSWVVENGRKELTGPDRKVETKGKKCPQKPKAESRKPRSSRGPKG